VYPACRAHASYCMACQDPQYFPHCFINGMIFEEKLLNTKRVFWFSVQRLCETFLILKKNWAKYYEKCTSILRFLLSTHYSCPILIKLVSSWQNFEIYSTINFHENPSSGSRVVACGWTDMTNLIVFSQFCERGYKYVGAFCRNLYQT
jgi:hypothetical protein